MGGVKSEGVEQRIDQNAVPMHLGMNLFDVRIGLESPVLNLFVLH